MKILGSLNPQVKVDKACRNPPMESIFPATLVLTVMPPAMDLPQVPHQYKNVFVFWRMNPIERADMSSARTPVVHPPAMCLSRLRNKSAKQVHQQIAFLRRSHRYSNPEI